MSDTTQTQTPAPMTLEQAVSMFAQVLETFKANGILPNTPSIAPAAIPIVPGEVGGHSSAGLLERLGADTAVRTMPMRGPGGKFLPRGLAASVAPAAPVKKEPKAKKEKVVKVRPEPLPHKVDAFVGWFFKTPQAELRNARCGRYEIVKGSDKHADILYFHSSRDGEAQDANNVVGIRPANSELGVFNATRLRYGNSSAEQLRPQVAAEAAGAVPVPFENVVSKSGGAGLDLTKLEIVAWNKAEDMVIPPVARGRQWAGKFYVTVRHFAGALLLKIENKYFLFDTDREELTHAGFNPFFTQLPGPAKDIAEAYKLLMPAEAQEAVAEGKDVRRQGEFFFIPVTDEEFVKGLGIDVNSRAAMRDIRRVTEDFEDVGGAHYMWMAVDRAEEIKAFIARCDKLNGGFLPQGNTQESDAHLIVAGGSMYDGNREDAFKRVGRSKVKAGEALNSLVDRYLDFSELSIGALDEREGKNAYQRYLAKVEALEEIRRDNRENNRSRTLPYVKSASERSQEATATHLNAIASALASQCRVAMSGKDVIAQGRLASAYGICYSLRLGAEGDTGTRNAHVATGTAVVPLRRKGSEKQTIYAIGAVTHTGREHRPLYLPGWHKVVSNTATANWTVSGAVD